MYESIVKKQRAKINKLTLKQQQQILNLYDDAIKNLSNQISRSREKTLQKRWQLDYLKELKNTRQKLENKLEKEIIRSTQKSAEIGTQAEKQIMSNIFKRSKIDVGPHFTEMFSQIQNNVVKNIITGNLYKDHKTLSQRIWETGNEFEKDIQYTINQAILQKKTAIELASDLEKFVKDPAKRGSNWGKAYPHLKNKQVDYNAMRLARTSINHAYQTSSIQSSNINPFVDGIEWRSALIHGRTCAICAERHGEIYPKDDVPIDHPNGLCTMMPVIERSLDDVAKELADWLRGEDNPTLDDWYTQYGIYMIDTSQYTKMKDVTTKERYMYKTTKEAFKRVAYTNIEKPYATVLDQELLNIVNRYPIESQDITVKALKEKNAFGYRAFGITHNKKTNKLALRNEIVYSNELHKNKKVSEEYHIMNYKLRGSLLQNSKKAHLATISHEYGHAIDDQYLIAKNKQIKDDIMKIVGKKPDVDTIFIANTVNRKLAYSKDKLSNVLWDQMQEKYDMGQKEFMQKVKDELGEYAATSREEFLAEGFANMMCLPEKEKTDFIKTFEDLFNQEFNKVFRGGK